MVTKGPEVKVDLKIVFIETTRVKLLSKWGMRQDSSCVHRQYNCSSVFLVLENFNVSQTLSYSALTVNLTQHSCLGQFHLGNCFHGTELWGRSMGISF